MDINAEFQWKCQPEAEAFILEIVDRAARSNPDISILSNELLTKTSTRLFDWIDHVIVPESEAALAKIREIGYERQGNGNQVVYNHPGAQLPRVQLQSSKAHEAGLAVVVDSISDFLMVRGEKRQIEGTHFGEFRRCKYSEKNGVTLWIIERRGSLSLLPHKETAKEMESRYKALERWVTRPRPLENEDQAMLETIELAQELVEEVGQQRAAWTVLEGERRYWQARNTAGQIQKNRQDRLGMGWANHDHHTFRSSRKRFQQLVHLFELLGFHCRERFYAGEEAGWGAQVMENPICRLVLFLDVDLSGEEITEDFAHEPLPEIDKLGTIGLWCALHGDSILKSGMHHLEAQFMFDELAQDLGGMGIKMMNPFSSFSYLRQAFTAGENWQVDPVHVKRLAKQGKITEEQADKFIVHGAIGSHLENLQRREGFKGFNPKSVSIIIKQTDPRLS